MRTCKVLLKDSLCRFFFSINIPIFVPIEQTLNMKNWVVKLISLLLIPSLLGVLFTLLLGSNPGGWLQKATYIFPPAITLVFAAFLTHGRWKVPFLLFMGGASIAFNIPLQNWLFHSADEVVHYASITDLYEADKNVLYFTFDTLDVDYARRSSVTIIREVTRSVGRRRHQIEQKQYYYSVVPVFTDSLPKRKYAEREVKAWIIPVKSTKDQPVICYERCLYELEDYQKAIDKSQCKIHHPKAPIIRPLYSPFITQREWKKIFLNAAWIVLSVLIVVGVIINHRLDRKLENG